MKELDEAVSYLKKDNHLGMVYGIMKKYGVRPEQEDYEDLALKGQILFIKAYLECIKKGILRDGKILAYSYQKIKWGLLDALKQKARYQKQIAAPNKDETSDFLTNLPDKNLNAEKKLILKENLQQLFLQCNLREKKYLALKLADLTDMDIVRKYHLNHTRVYRVRNKVRQKAFKIFFN